MTTTPHILANGDLLQDWSNGGLITADDNWSGVPSIEGFRGDGLASTGANPQTILAADAAGVSDVNANRADLTFNTGGIAEFQIADPTVALQGSGTADAPYLLLHLDATGTQDVTLSFLARHLDADNATQQIAVQYRIGNSGNFTNLPAGYIADAANGAGTSTPVIVTLPADANNASLVQIRIMTADASGSDSWIGIDNIHVSSEPIVTDVQTVGFAAGSLSVSQDEGNAGTTTFSFTVERQGGTEGEITFSGTIASSEADGADFVGGAPLTFTGTIPDGAASAVITVEVAGDATTEPDEDFTLTLTNVSNTAPVATSIGASDVATGTIVNDDVILTRISAIQGSGASSGMVGQTVAVEAIVVGDFQDGDADGGRDLGGFYLQEEIVDSDGNALTSEGIFVFGPAADLQVGDRVRVTGTVTEFFGLTELSATSVFVVEPGAVDDVGTMAAVIDLPSAGVTLNQNGQYQPDLEAYEGMLVTIPETLTVTEQFNLDRFNEIRLAAGERPTQFTHDNLPSIEGYEQHRQDVGGRTIVYDDGLLSQNEPIGNLDGYGPVYDTADAPRMGDTVTGLTGVLDYQWAGASASGSTWRVRAIEGGANEFESANARPEEAPDVGGRLQVGSFNVLNYFKTISGDTAIGQDPRGANSAAEFARQTEKLVNVLAEMDADVLGLIEIENDFLAGSSGNALQYLVDQLNAKVGAGTYACVDPGQQFIGGDAIAVACIYKPSEVRVALDTTVEILDDSDVGADLLAQSEIGHVFNGVNTSRAVLTVTFEEIDTGYDFTAAINHFKSKSVSADAPPTGEDLDILDGQGAWQNQRELAAEALTTWLESDPTGSNDGDFMLLGDFNAYFMEDTIRLIEDAGYENLQQRLDDPYSYVFDGQTGSLDYIFANESLAAQVTGVAEWHINADEADALDYNLDFGRDPNIFDADTLARVSDHDPILIGLDLTEEPTVPAYTLQLLHLADGEAGLLAADTAPNLAALVDAFDDDYANTLILAGGDNWIPGPFLAAGTDLSVADELNQVTGSTIAPGANIPIAAVDIAIHNLIGVEASALGNHDFDLGSNVLAASLAAGGGWVGAQFPSISANLVTGPSSPYYTNPAATDSALNGIYVDTVDFNIQPGVNQPATTTQIAEASTLKGKIVPAAVITEGGEKIGLVGATTQILESISSPSGAEIAGFPGGGGPNGELDDMDLLAAQLQPIIDEMIAEGINKIVLMSHLQVLANERLLATKLKGVDIILSAGSNTRLGDADDEAVDFPGHDDNFADTYPLQITNAEGKTTLIVNTDNEYTYLGRLVVDFDENGDIILDSLTANQPINGAYASTDENVAEAWGTSVDNLDETAFAEGTKGGKVQTLTEAVRDVIEVKDGNVYGYSNVYLEGERGLVRNEETNLGNLSADANAGVLKTALETALGSAAETAYVVSIKNGGGIRAQIGTLSAPDPVTGEVEKLPPDGGVSQLDVENSLRFNNKLMAFDTTAQGLKAILEHGVGLLPNQGRFPQLGGVAFSFDPDAPAGSRVSDIALIDDEGNTIVKLYDDGVLLDGVPSTITMVTLNFMADGGDGYPMKANGENFRYLIDDGTFGPILDENGDLDGSPPANAMGEQRAFELYMRANHGTPEEAYDEADTPASLDERIQNLNARAEDTVLDAVAETFNGTNAANDFDGGALNDTASGNGGDDVLNGHGGDDLLRGGSGDDLLVGGAGDDTLDGGRDDDELFGGEGDDTYVYEQGDGSDTILEAAESGGGAILLSAPAGGDRIVFEDIDAWDVEFRQVGDDVQVLVGRGEVITLKDQLAGGGVEAIVFDRGGTFDRDDIRDAAVDDAPVVTTPADVTTQEDKSASGRIQAEDPEGEGLRFSIKPGAGPANGSVSIGRDGRWTYKPAANFFGVDAFIVLVSDGVSATEAVVNVEVASVNDKPDTAKDFGLVGENEVKLFDLTANDEDVEDGEPQLIGFNIKDVDGISLSSQQARAAFSIENGELKFDPGSLFDRLDGGDKAEVEISYTVRDSSGAIATEEFVLKVVGSDDPNVITGTNGSNDIRGTGKADIIYGLGGHDEIDGRDGDDEIHAGSGNDEAEGGDGHDIIFGDEGDDDLRGNDGRDILAGGTGNDRMWGGDDGDIFVFAPGDGRDTVYDFGRNDIVQLDAGVFADFTALISSGAISQSFGSVRIAYDAGNVLTLDDVHISSLDADDFRFV